ncbi:MAG: T9SS type A sorting domain-containing protein [Bacteroidales bacterium]|nr:T9SS type A sorting domain-containing protein [Bacteroidales bacterium]
MIKKLFILQIVVIALISQLQAQYNLEWNQQNSGTQEVLKSVYFVDTLQGYAVGHNGEIIHTANGGELWETQTSGVSTHLNVVHFIDNSLGWVVGNKGVDEPVILKTINGGEDWMAQSLGINWNPDLIDVNFISEMAGWVITSDSILKTMDGGVTWKTEKIVGNINYLFSDIEFTENGTGWITGRSQSPAQGLILRQFIDGPDTTWFKSQTYDDKLFAKIKFIDDSTGWATSGSDIARKTINDPYTWSLETTGAQSNNFVFFDKLNGLIFGEEGFVFTSSDGGINWEVQDTVSTGFTTMYGIFAADQYNIWTVGPQGTIFKATEAPSGIGELIQQNNFIFYPVNNSSKGNMTLNLSIMNKSSLVNLDIYNIQGQKIMNLESNTLVPGNYQYEISNTIKSGVYIVRLLVDGKIVSQKFIK